MKKRFSILFLVIVLVLSACGKEDDSPEAKANKETGKNGKEPAELQQLEIVKQNVQLGGESLPGDAPSTIPYRYKLHVLESDGYTYFIERSEGKDNHTGFYVSVEKDNKWEVMEKEVEVAIDVPGGFAGSEIMDSGGSLLLRFDGYEGDYFYKLSFNPSGEITAKLVLKLESEEDFETDLLTGSDGKAYIYQLNDDDTFTIFDDEGKKSFEFENKNDSTVPLLSSILNGAFLDLDNEILYFGGDLQTPGQMIDLKEGDLVWEESGKEKLYDMKEVRFTSLYKSNKKGLYTLSDFDWNFELAYSNMGEDGLETLSYSELPEAIKDLQIWNAKMIASKNEINVYALVIYKGKRTIQKYTFNRID